MDGYPRGFGTILLVTLFIVFATGALLVPGLLVVRLGWDLPWRLPGDARILAAAGHVTFAFALLALIGALWSLHMRRGWRKKRARITGASLLLFWTALALSSAGILYFGDERASLMASVVHTLLGVGLPLLLLAHVTVGLMSRRTATAARHREPCGKTAPQKANARRPSWPAGREGPGVRSLP